MSEEEVKKSVFTVANYVYQIWKKIPRTKVLNQEATINAPEGIVNYTIAVSVPSSFRSLRKPIAFNHNGIIRIIAVSLHPYFGTIKNAIQRLDYEDGTSSFVLYPELLPSDTDSISLSISYRVDDQFFIDALVDRQNAHEPAGVEKNEYWMSAQLKHPKVLRDNFGFGRFDLKDVDVTVDVGVHNEIKTSLPSSFIGRLKTFFAIMGEVDPRKQYQAVPKLRKLATEKTAGHEFEILSELESLFLPISFAKFLDVTKDFHYSDCYKSKECFELPMEIIPKRMNVISRASLTIDEPTANGILLYKNNQFMDAIKKIAKA